jgi:hypothetical protein
LRMEILTREAIPRKWIVRRKYKYLTVRQQS